MNVKLSKIILFLIILSAACSINQNSESEQIVPPPLHPIFGKWENRNSSDVLPKINLSFDDNNILRVEVFTSRGETEINYYEFETFPDDSASFFYTRTANEGLKISADVKVQPNGNLTLSCRSSELPRYSAAAFKDPPLLCSFREFGKVNNL